MTCKDCVHYDVCQALEDNGQACKIHPVQCGCFKDKSRFVELPCKVGDTVYQVGTNGILYSSEITKMIYDTKGIAFDERAIGKTIFLTKAEAEAKVKEKRQMREILFRGKHTDNGEWVEGYYCGKVNKTFFSPAEDSAQIIDKDLFWHEVVPETVGQYTGLTDKNGKKIFEGDIFKPFDDEICYVAWIEHFSTLGLMVHSTWREKKRGKEILHFSKGWTYLTEYSLNELEILGNIHDNPELLGGAE